MLDTQIRTIDGRQSLYTLGTSKSLVQGLQTSSRKEAKQLWLHIHLPQFSLEMLTCGSSDRKACVLVEGQGSRLKIVQANSHATSLGVRLGMSLSAAQILGDLAVLSRNERAESQTLGRLCAWAYQFTPIISAVPPDGLLLEIKSSLKLFGGAQELLNEVRRGLRDLGHKALIAIAPTPAAATLLARAERQCTVLHEQELPNVLGPLPLEALRLEPKQLAVLNGIGAQSINDCLRLPRDGLGRRTAPTVVEKFSRLLGRTSDPRPRFKLPKLFQSSLELPWETNNAQSLGVAGGRLLHELTGYLRSCAAVTRYLRWTLNYVDGQALNFQLELTQPTREHAHFALLLRERLSRIQLTDKVKGISLYVDDINPEQVVTEADLFKRQPTGGGEDWPSFLDRLRARLGEQAVRGLQRVSDHRPECAWRWTDVPSHLRESTQSSTRLSSLAPERPLWLMRRPIRLRKEQGHLNINGRLQLVEERERIETGWWDGKPVGRDYFVAANPRGARLWIYRELSGDKDWYLHGIFE
jgi:protein ImuB